jgi:hypothetical protein
MSSTTFTVILARQRQSADRKVTVLGERKRQFFFSSPIICELAVANLAPNYKIALYYNDA